MTPFNRLAILLLATSLSLTAARHAQGADKLPDYVPVLPQVKARALPVDPQKGYLVKQVKPGVFVITEGIYQSAFVTEVVEYFSDSRPLDR